MSTATAQDFSKGPVDIFAGCEAQAPAAAGSPRERIGQQAAPKVDKVTQRSFASFSLDDIDKGVPSDMSSLCWARLDGVWREVGQVVLDKSKNNSGVWGSSSPDLLSLANGTYSTPRYIVIVEPADPEKALWLAPGLTGAPFVKFQSADGVSLKDVLKRGGDRKTYVASGAFEYGQQMVMDVTRTGRVRLSLGNSEFVRPQPGVSQTTIASQVASDDAFLLSYNLENLAASRRGYDPITQDPFKLLDNPKLEVFAKVDPKNYYITEKRTVPVGFILIQDDSQGMVFRKSLMSSEKEIQETNGHSFGANLGTGAAYAGFDYAESTMQSMRESQSVAQAIGYSRQKQYTLVVDHPYITLSAEFIDAVEDARRYFKYQALIDKFGTHFPYAVTYGAAAKFTQTFTESSYTERAQKSRNFAAQAGGTLMGVGGSVQGGLKSESISGTSGSIGDDRIAFVAVGGNGSWDQNGYVAGNTPYPILLDLRPIDELLNPMNFPGEPQVYDTVRRNLHRAIAAYVAKNTHPLSTQSLLPVVAPVAPEQPKPVERWTVYVRHLACTKGLGDFTKQVSGWVSLEGIPGSDGSSEQRAPDKKVSAPCKLKREYEAFGYGPGAAGLLAISGTRQEIAGYSVHVTLRVDGRDKPAEWQVAQPEPLRKGLNVGATQSMAWEIEAPLKPKIWVDIRFKRER